CCCLASASSASFFFVFPCALIHFSLASAAFFCASARFFVCSVDSCLALSVFRAGVEGIIARLSPRKVNPKKVHIFPIEHLVSTIRCFGYESSLPFNSSPCDKAVNTISTVTLVCAVTAAHRARMFSNSRTSTTKVKEAGISLFHWQFALNRLRRARIKFQKGTIPKILLAQGTITMKALSQGSMRYPMLIIGTRTLLLGTSSTAFRIRLLCFCRERCADLSSRRA